MARHSFIQISKLPNLKGRIDYITNPKRQENLYATYNTTDDAFWGERNFFLGNGCGVEYRNPSDGRHAPIP